jgi:hypothetical protein
MTASTSANTAMSSSSDHHHNRSNYDELDAVAAGGNALHPQKEATIASINATNEKALNMSPTYLPTVTPRTTRTASTTTSPSEADDDNDSGNNDSDNNEEVANRESSNDGEEAEDNSGIDESTSSNATLDEIWKAVTVSNDASSNNNGGANNAATNAMQQAVQQTTTLLLEQYELLVQPAQQAILELEQAKIQIRTLQTANQTKDRELSLLQQSEQQSQKSIAVSSEQCCTMQ